MQKPLEKLVTSNPQPEKLWNPLKFSPYVKWEFRTLTMLALPLSKCNANQATQANQVPIQLSFDLVSEHWQVFTEAHYLRAPGV